MSLKMFLLGLTMILKAFRQNWCNIKLNLTHLYLQFTKQEHNKNILQHLLGVITPQKIASKFLLIAQTMHLPTYIVTDDFNFASSLDS